MKVEHEKDINQVQKILKKNQMLTKTDSINQTGFKALTSITFFLTMETRTK